LVLVLIWSAARAAFFGRNCMKQPSAYLKMRVLGAIDTAEGKTHEERIKNVG
jgi:hypothetical protein